MPVCVIGGLTIVNGFLLVALKIEGHEFGLDGKVWTIDGKDITQLTENHPLPLGDSKQSENGL